MTATTTKGSHVLRIADESNSARIGAMLGGAPGRERTGVHVATSPGREGGSEVAGLVSEGT